MRTPAILVLETIPVEAVHHTRQLHLHQRRLPLLQGRTKQPKTQQTVQTIQAPNQLLDLELDQFRAGEKKVQIRTGTGGSRLFFISSMIACTEGKQENKRK
jgi:hypothetical protein